MKLYLIAMLMAFVVLSANAKPMTGSVESWEGVFNLNATNTPIRIAGLPAILLWRYLQRRFEVEFTWEKLKPQFISIYTNAYSPAELKAYVEFYSSPEGRVRMERWRQTRDAIGTMLEKKAAELGANFLR